MTYEKYNDEVPELNPSTPGDIRRSSTNNDDLLSICRYLKECGYSLSSIISLVNNIHVTSKHQAIDLMVKTDSGYAHPYIPDRDNLCVICKESYKEHLQFVGGEGIPNGYQEELSQMLRNESKNSNEVLEAVNKFKAEFEVCPICSENSDSYINVSRCNHRLCKNCIEAYIKSKLSENNILKIKCPYNGCDVELNENDIEQLCGKEQFEKYKYLILNMKVNTSTNLKWCPKPRCNNIIEKNPNSQRAICTTCGFEICFKCGEAWHGNASCDKAIDKKYSEWAKNKVLEKCPNCKMVVEKNSGCNHMTCISCQYQWCWLCGQKYTSTHFNTSLFGCIGWQYTTSVTFASFLCKLIATIVFWPLVSFCLMCSGEYMSNICSIFDRCEGIGVILRVLFGFLMPAFYIIAYVIFLPPSWIYQIYMNLMMICRWKYLKA